MFSLRSISIKGAIALIALAARAQINPANQINWPTGSAGCVYAPGTNTCILPSGSGVLHSGVGAPNEGTAATITHVSSNIVLASGNSVTTGAGTGASGSSPGTITAGQIIIATIGGEMPVSPASTTPTDTLGTTYVLVSSNYIGGTGVYSWIGQAASSGSDAVTWNPATGINLELAIDVYSGAAPIVDGTAASVFGVANPSTTLTNYLAGDLVFGGASWDGAHGTGLTFTASSGFTLASTFAAASTQNPMATEYDLSGPSGAQTVAISQSGNTGSASSFGAFSLFAIHTGSVGNDGDFYLDTQSGKVYGPRLDGIYLPVGAGLGMVKVDGTSITIVNGVISATTPPVSAFQQIGQVILGSGGASSITISSIPGTYTNLKLTCSALTTASGVNVWMQINGDTGNNYEFYGLGGTGNFSSGGFTNEAFVGYGSNTINPAQMTVQLNGYANTFYKGGTGLWASASSAANGVVSFNWNSASAITSLKVYPASGTFVQYSECTLYGEL